MMERDCYGEAKAASELTKRERFFLVYELIQKTNSLEKIKFE